MKIMSWPHSIWSIIYVCTEFSKRMRNSIIWHVKAIT